MSRKAEKENQILDAIHDGIDKDELFSRLVGTSYKESTVKSLHRAYRNLLKKKMIAEEWRTMLKGFDIKIVTWVIVPKKMKLPNLGTITAAVANGGKDEISF
jgi:hypothetical protein